MGGFILGLNGVNMGLGVSRTWKLTHLVTASCLVEDCIAAVGGKPVSACGHSISSDGAQAGIQDGVEVKHRAEQLVSKEERVMSKAASSEALST